MSEALERIYASAPADAYPIDTLEIAHDSFAEPYRFARSFSDVDATLETAEAVTFQASGIGLSLPQQGIQGRQDLVFQLDNVSGEAIAAIRTAQEAGGTITITYRCYDSSDLSAPAGGPIALVALSAKATIRSVQVVATFRDFVNKAWPRLRYTLDLTPGLKYVSG